ncbi:PREDICTED: ubiquitin carboxyl-terminal hydrolase 42-like isoform X3 [Ficedula albicollis]|uniref:Ubiquitin carboxyl-terminal hydrolase n=2 Tax=Ficedula albicollis TaxID=59894 RepID=U3JSA5_FICAL|nr:PREDICTED: ubiquitin carboxyl-terminal hydrolase 42-like isoform X3 [Ficedula albicollis]
MTPPRKSLFTPEKICMDWRQKRRPGAGLHNLGSTCYLNVILQCLTYTAPLANYLLSRQHSRFCRRQGFCMMCIMEVHVRKVLFSSATAIRPRAVVRDLKFIGEFQPDYPGDAYEFLRCTVNAMQRACLSGSRDSDSSSGETTIIHQIFGGYLRSRVTCLSCKTVSDFFRAFRDVLLKIKGALSLTTALEHFMAPKQTEGRKCFKCRKCKKKVAVSKVVTVHRAPRIFTVCLGRADDGTSRKLSQVVEYPECLDLRPYMSDPDREPLLYSLYAVVVHSGHTCLGGHFFCYIKASDGQWYKMNDVSVESCDLHTALGQQAYLLFYARCFNSQSKEMASPTLPPFLNQGESSSQAGSAQPQAVPGRIRVPKSRRSSAKEREKDKGDKERSRSPQWGNERHRCFINSNYSSSAGRRRKRTSPPDHDNTHRDATGPGPSSRSFQHAAAHRAAWEQPLPGERLQSKPSQLGCNLCRQLVKIRNYHQAQSKRRKLSFGAYKQKSQTYN